MTNEINKMVAQLQATRSGADLDKPSGSIPLRLAAMDLRQAAHALMLGWIKSLDNLSAAEQDRFKMDISFLVENLYDASLEILYNRHSNSDYLTSDPGDEHDANVHV